MEVAFTSSAGPATRNPRATKQEEALIPNFEAGQFGGMCGEVWRRGNRKKRLRDYSITTRRQPHLLSYTPMNNGTVHF